jgi:uncharacterized phage-associated protein
MAVHFTFKFRKAQASLLYLASKDLPGFTKGKVCKLLFLADKHHLVRHARPVTGDRYTAVPHGPIPSRMKDILDEVESGNPVSPEAIEMASAVELDRRFQYPRIRPMKEAEMGELSESDIESLDAVASSFGSKTFTELRSITHEMPAYDNAWTAKPAPKQQAWMHFEDFFEEDEGSRAGVREEMLENDALRKSFPDPAWF